LRFDININIGSSKFYHKCSEVEYLTFFIALVFIIDFLANYDTI